MRVFLMYVYVDILYLWLLNFAHDNTFSDTENDV